MGKNTITFLSLLLTLTFYSSARHSLTIRIEGLQNNKGSVRLGLFDKEEKLIQGASQAIERNSCTIILDSLPAGIYAFKYYHDENKNQRLDFNWMGIPTEGYGFSNNAKGRLGPPAFEKMTFELHSDTTQQCKPVYF